MPKKQELPKLLTIKQAAEVLNVHVETLRRCYQPPVLTEC